jgi:hypothetical protein
VPEFEIDIQGHAHCQSLCLTLFHARVDYNVAMEMNHFLEEGSNQNEDTETIVKQCSRGGKTKCHKSHHRIAGSTPAADILHNAGITRTYANLHALSSQKSLLLARLSFRSTDIIDTTTSTLGCVLESGRSIGKCLSNSASDVTDDTSDSVYSA